MSSTRSTVMADGGEYSRHNAQGYATAQRVKPFVMNAVQDAQRDVNKSTTFCYCDFGAADGGMASVIARDVIKTLRIWKTTQDNSRETFTLSSKIKR